MVSGYLLNRILEPDVNTENIDGKHCVMLSFHCPIKTYCVISIIIMSWLLDFLGEGNLGEANI